MATSQKTDRYLEGISPKLTADLLASSNDISLVIDEQGVIRDVGIDGGSSLFEEFGGLLNKDWLDTVTSESREKFMTCWRSRRKLRRPDGGRLIIMQETMITSRSCTACLHGMTMGI